MLRILRIVSSIRKLAIVKLRYPSVDVVVNVERDGPISNGFIPERKISLDWRVERQETKACLQVIDRTDNIVAQWLQILLHSLV